MSLDTKHSQYVGYAGKWSKLRDVLAGEERIKARGSVYVPKLSKQTDPEFQAYVNRGCFFAATDRTRQGLLGSIFRKAPVIAYPKLDDLKQVNLFYESLTVFATGSVDEILSVGRTGILLDFRTSGLSYFVQYQAENIINWKSVRTPEGEVLTMVILKESYFDYSEDEYKGQETIRYKKLYLDRGIYKQSMYEPIKSSDEFVLISHTMPLVNGSSLGYIPFKFINVSNSSSTCSNPPLNALANVNLSQWRNSVDLEHGRHFTGLPTPTAVGVPAASEFRIGSSIAWTSTNPDTRFSMLEYTGQGLGALEKAIKEKSDQMAILGARILEAPKAGVEAEGTHRIRKSSEDSILAQITNNASIAITELLKWKFKSDYFYEDEDIHCELNRDYVVGQLSPQEITSLVQSWQSGAISYKTLFYNFKRGELIPENLSFEEEQALIKSEMRLLNIE